MFTPIPPDKLKSQLNRLVHVKWARRGTTWKLISFDLESGVAELKTPKTHKTMTAKITDLCYTRANEP